MKKDDFLRTTAIFVIGLLITTIFYSSSVFAIPCDEHPHKYINKILFYVPYKSEEFETMIDYLGEQGYCVDVYDTEIITKSISMSGVYDFRTLQYSYFNSSLITSEILDYNYSQIWVFDTDSSEANFNADEFENLVEEFIDGKGFFLVGEEESLVTSYIKWKKWYSNLVHAFEFIVGAIIGVISVMASATIVGISVGTAGLAVSGKLIYESFQSFDKHKKGMDLNYDNQVDSVLKSIFVVITNQQIAPEANIFQGASIYSHFKVKNIYKKIAGIKTKVGELIADTLYSPYISKSTKAENITKLSDHKVLKGVDKLYFSKRQSELILPENTSDIITPLISKKVFSPDPETFGIKKTPGDAVVAAAIEFSSALGNVFLDTSWVKFTDNVFADDDQKGDIKIYITNIAKLLDIERDSFKHVCLEDIEEKEFFTDTDFDPNISTTYAWGNFDKNILTVNDNCCGDDDEDDLGLVVDNRKNLCYNSEVESTQGFWGWRRASDYPLAIKTINKTNEIYDVASNKFKWHECGGDTISYGDTLIDAPSIICFEGNSAYAQCCAQNLDGCGEDQNPEDKKRGLGELISTLDNDLSFSFEFDYPLKEYIDSPAYKPVPIQETKTKIKNWESYRYLEFDFIPDSFYDYQILFIEGEAGDDVNNPNETTVIFRGSIFDYVIDTPKKQESQHVSIPLTQLDKDNIDHILFYINTTEIEQGPPTIIEIFNLNLISENSNLNIYCSESLDVWIDDLDREQNACDIYSYDWTGTKCCGDDNFADSGEYYSDTEAGCWNGNIVKNSTIMEIEFEIEDKSKDYICKENKCEYPSSSKIDITNKYPDLYDLYPDNDTKQVIANKVPQQLLYFNKTFYGCNLAPYIKTTAMSNNVFIDESTPTCGTKGDYFCSTKLGWSDEESPNGTTAGMRNTTSTLLPEIPLTDSIVVSNCCAPEYCWNGTSCIDSMHEDPNATYSFEGTNDTFRCILGTWGIAVEKQDWNNDKSGYCPKITDCLVDPDGDAENNYNTTLYFGDLNSENPQCVADNQYIEDHYCVNGSWTSRTKFIASTLLDTVSRDFILYCDDYAIALPDYEYADEYLSGRVIDESFGEISRACYTEDEVSEFFGSGTVYQKPCVNNFCILKTADDTVFGTSLNKPVNDNKFSILYALLDSQDEDFCFKGTLAGDGNYKKCRSSDEIWYNNITNSIIYSKKGTDLEPPTSLQKLWNFFTSLLQWITGNFKPQTVIGEVNLTFFEKVKDYNRLYAQQKDNKSVYAVIEKVDVNNITITVRYQNTLTDICDSVEKLSRKDPYTSTFCNQTDSKFTIITDQPKLWPQLTAKIRLI